ncbi:MAG: hypothetical protein MRY78_13440, partial [Saprospiraceae bacterium]|nr:hypothetical protein [Saprospiraceae bacterium]
MKAALICICLLFIGHFAHGQLLHFPCPDPNSPMTSTCDEACVICDLDGYTSTNSLTDLGEIPEGFCGEQHNTQWLAFMTSTPFLSLEVTAFSCSVNFQGIQVGLYSSNDCTNFDLISNCDNQIDPFSSDTITANNLFTGVIYYLVIDGFNGDICEFTIDVLEGSATNPDVVGTPEIIGLSQHCWGVQPRYYGTQVPGATDRTWTLDGEIVGHNFFVDLEFQTPGLYELCLTPSNPCYGPGETVCKDIEIVALEPIFSEFRVCEEEFPFEYLNTTFNSPGSYSISYYDQDSCIQTEFISLIEIDYPPTIEEFEYCFNEPYIIGSEVITEEGIYFVDLQTVEGCDSVVVLIIDEVADYETMVQDTICSNETYQLGNQSLETSGTFSATLQASDGCDSLVTLELEVLPAVEEFIQASICQGDTLTLDTFSFTLSGNYPLVYTAANGCDSTLFVDLTVLPSYEDTLEIQICEGEQFVFQTDILEASGIYCYEFTTQDGCDSLIYVDIQQFPSYFFVIDTSICANQNFTFLDSTLEISGTYEFGYQTENNCDSIYQVNLEIWPLDTTPIFTEICEGDSFALAGQTFTATGNYELFLPSASCDSLLQLTLNVIPPATQEIDTTICQGDSLSLNGESLFENGTYVQMLQADSGCDSILTIQLEILEAPPLLSLNETICTGDSLLLADTAFHESGIYELLLTAQNGCDSLIMLELTVIENDTTFLNEEICDGTVFDFHAQALSEAGTYRFDTISITGCDSTIILDLSVNPETFFGLDTILCPGNTFVLQDTSFDIAGDYTWTLTNQFGCDSTIEIKLEYFEENITLIDTSICQGESLIVGNDTLNTSGSFVITTTDHNGCDAITNIELEVLSQSDTTLLFNICEGETLNYQDSILQQSGNYAFLMTNAQGCDSLIEVQLNVLPSQMENEEVVLCFGESLEWQDTTIMTTGFYQQIYQSQFGCDSIYQLEVEVLENNETLLFDTICNGETYTLGDQSLSTSGSYIYESTDQYSCDSVVLLELIVLPELDTFLNQQICVGDSIIIDGTAFSESGTYEIELVSSTTGCDSLVILDLEVRPTYEIEETYTICGSNSIEIEGQIIEEAGTYQFDYLTEAGCDSTIVVMVEASPEYADSLYYNICEGATIMVGDSTLSEAGTYIF